MTCVVFPKAILHPFGQLLDCPLCCLYRVVVIASLIFPLLRLCSTVTRGKDTVARLLRTHPFPPKGEGLVGDEFRCFLGTCVGSRNASSFRHWYWRGGVAKLGSKESRGTRTCFNSKLGYRVHIGEVGRLL